MKGTNTDKNQLRNNVSVQPKCRIVLELNQNRYHSLDEEYVNDNKSVYYGTDEDDQNYYSDRFPVFSVTKSIRPQKTGMCYGRKMSASSKSSIPSYLFHSKNVFNTISSSVYSLVDSQNKYTETRTPRPRIYYPGPSIPYQYYSQPASSAGGWDPFMVPLIYTSKFWTNKIVIGFETTLGSPSPSSNACFNVYVLPVGADKETGWELAYSTSTDPVNSRGRVTIYRTSGAYNVAGTWTTNKPSYDVAGGFWDSSSTGALPGYIPTAAKIQGIKIDCPKPAGPVSLIEVSPKLTTDVTDKVISWNWDANLAEQDSLHPIGTLSANTGSIEIDNSQGHFDASTGYGVQASLAILTVPECEAFGFASVDSSAPVTDVVTYGAEFQQFSAFIERWNENNESVYSLPIKDIIGLMQEVQSPVTIFKNITPSQAIWRLLDMAGIGPVEVSDSLNISRGDSETGRYTEDIMPAFFTSPKSTLWSSIQKLCGDTRYAVVASETGTIKILTRDFLFDNRRGDTPDWQFLGENSGSQYADIETLNSEKQNPLNSIKISYNPIEPVDVENDTRVTALTNKKDFLKNVQAWQVASNKKLWSDPDTQNEAVGISLMAKSVSGVFDIVSITTVNSKIKQATLKTAPTFVSGDRIKIYGINTDSLNGHYIVTGVNAVNKTVNYSSDNPEVYTRGNDAADGSLGTMYDADIRVLNQAYVFGLWGRWSGYMLIDEELIKYNGAEYQYVSGIDNLKKTVIVKTREDLFEARSNALGQVTFTGRFTGIERGAFATTAVPHNKGIDASWVYPNDINSKSFSLYAYQSTNNEGAVVQNALKIHRPTAGVGSLKTTMVKAFRKEYNNYFARIKITHRGHQESSGGIVVWPTVNSTTKHISSGIFFEITSMASEQKVKKTKDNPKGLKHIKAHSDKWKKSHHKTHEIRIYEFKSGKIDRSSMVKAYCDIRNGQVKDVRVTITKRNKKATTWSIYVSNKKEASIVVDNSDYSRVNKKRIGLFAVGKSTVYFDYVGGSNYVSVDDDNYDADLRHILSGVLANRTGKTRSVKFEVEKFDSCVRDVYYKKAEFTTTPAHSMSLQAYAVAGDGDKAKTKDGTDAMLAVDGDLAYALSEQTPGSAEILIVNISDGAKFFGLTSGYPYITGQTVEISQIQNFALEEDKDSIKRIGAKKFEQSVTWIATKSSAQALAKSILNLSKQGLYTINIESFTNHLIQIGDCVTINYSDKGFNADIPFVVVQVSSKWDNGLKNTIKLVNQYV